MSAKVTITGLASLQQFFATADRNLRAEAMTVVRATTEGAATDIKRGYTRGTTGNLQNRVSTSYPASTVLVGVVLSKAPHSHLYEFGTKARQTKGGASRGRMPANPVTPDIAQRRRLEMERKLIEVIRAAGFDIDDAR